MKNMRSMWMLLIIQWYFVVQEDFFKLETFMDKLAIYGERNLQKFKLSEKAQKKKTLIMLVRVISYKAE